jgi:protein SCO1/2
MKRAIVLIFFCVTSIYAQANERWKQYEFTNHKNESVKTERFLGQYVIVNFTYTDCVVYCTTQTHQLKNLRSRLVNEVQNKNIVFLSISMRPDRDTPKSLNSFAKRFLLEDCTDWQFVTGKQVEIAALMDDLGVKVAYGNTPNQFNHTTKIYLLDTLGKMAEAFEGIPIEDEKIIRKINALEKNSI